MKLNVSLRCNYVSMVFYLCLAKVWFLHSGLGLGTKPTWSRLGKHHSWLKIPILVTPNMAGNVQRCPSK